MRVVSRAILRAFWTSYPITEGPLKTWFKEAELARWRTPDEVKQRYPKASILNDNRVVFNICGNDYRLVVKIHYNTGVIFIRFVDTHEEYDKINAETI